jgi:2-polyprenyl-3-methyl-5-hydroxy-6-metoxy-1,4-benzoquinol methylase
VLAGLREEAIASHVGTGKRVLDIGCRDGALTTYFLPGNTVEGVEIDPVAAERARNNLHITVHEFNMHESWAPLNGKVYDVVVAGEVLEHLYYPNRIIAEVRKHLTEQGVFVLTVPNAFSLKNRLRLLCAQKKGTSLEDPTHINHFTVDEMSRLLSASFSRVEVYGLGRYKRLSSWFPQWFAFDLLFVAYR